MKCDRNKPGFALSLLTIAVTLAILLIGTKLSIPTIILLLIDILLLMALCVFYLHIPYRDVEKGMLGGIREAIITPLILMCAGMLIAARIQCGAVPMLILLRPGLAGCPVGPAHLLPALRGPLQLYRKLLEYGGDRGHRLRERGRQHGDPRGGHGRRRPLRRHLRR